MAEEYTDYDLAILGGSVASRQAACIAAQKGARVVLVAPGWQTHDAAVHCLELLLGPVLKSAQTEPENIQANRLVWESHQQNHLALSPAALSLQGIDVILEPVQFTDDRGLKSSDRYLRASRYLLADGYDDASAKTIDSTAEDIALLDAHLTKPDSLPTKIAVIGQGATAVEWAYALSRVAHVTLLSTAQQLLPAEDQTIQRLSEAQLRSLGITIVFPQDCSSVAVLRDRAQQLADYVLTVPHPHSWHSVGLDNLGIQSPVVVNSYLQTCCPCIYAVGGGLGGENRFELTQQETTVALNNALFGRRQVMHYETAGYSINLLSPIGRWGLTERQARHRYGDVKPFQASCLPTAAGHAGQVNFCKLIVQGRQILGVHLMGQDAPALAAAIGKLSNMGALGQWSTAYVQPGTLHDAIYQASQQWQSDRWYEGGWRRDWAENWFNWRRSL